MYILNKVVGWVTSPLGVLFCGLFAGWLIKRVCPRAGVRIAGNALVASTLILLWVASCGVTTRLVGLPLEGQEQSDDAILCGSMPAAIVLLGGGMGAHEKCGRAEMFSSADRVWCAAKIWRKLVISNEHPDSSRELKIFCSGGGVEVSTVPLLFDLGVSPESIVCLPQPRNTEEESRTIFERLASEGCARPEIILVTSAWHMPRAKVLFERAGFTVRSASCDYEMNYAAEEELKVGDFFPSAEALMRNSYAIKEWIARLGYAVVKR